MTTIIARFLLLSLAILAAGPTSAADIPPPWADAFKSPTAFLACQGNPYALCYYSGPDAPTQRSSNVPSPSLPCTFKDADGKVADCACYAVTEHSIGQKDVNYVLIHSILNTEIRQETVETCGALGEKCMNMANFDSCEVDNTQSHCQIAPVCSHLGNIEAGTKPDLYPNLPNVELISTFSFVNSYVHPFGSMDCSTIENPRYAGCMTAPCTTTDEGITTCECPVYDGPYQVGQNLSGMNGLGCDISPNVWSAADNVNQNQ